MLYFKHNLTLMVSEPIGRFFSDPLAQSCDSKIKKRRNIGLDKLMSNR